jgi:hypothetical protein
MYNSGNSSKNVRGSAIVDGTVEAADLATAVNNDIADGVAGKATADLALPKAGGAMTGAITTNSTFDGVDVATRDGVLTTTTATANDALPKAGGTMTGNIIMGTSGQGIDFSAATPDGTGTTGSEVLDDYEEGTFTPRIHDGTANSASTDINTGFYTKIGRHVHAQGHIRMTSKGSMTAGNIIRLDDFPFTLNTSTNCRTVCNIGTGSNFTLTAGTCVNGYAGPSSATAILRKWDTTGGSSYVLVSDLTDSTSFHFSMDYLTD